MQLEPGTRLGEYEIVGALGAGGMGEVYRARDHRLGREVAVKILPEAFAANQDRLLRLRREAQSAGGLNHPNLLTIHELGVDGGRTFIVSELLDGSTLRDRMSAGPMAPRRAIDYASQIAEGLAAAHERGVVHRDLKPENIFVTRDGRVKILDFGLAKTIEPVVPTAATETAKKSLTDPGAVVGTVGYMSPEQVRGGTVDARSDIFTLGAILYEMLSGRRAFSGTSSVDTMHAILHQDPPELLATNAQIPPGVARIVNHCLEKDAERRFQSARDLAFDLQSMSGTSGEAIAQKRRTRTPAALLWIAAIVIAAVASWFASRALLHRPLPQYQQLTFRAAANPTAAFTADQQSIICSMYDPNGNADIGILPIGSSEIRPIGVSGQVLSVSRTGEAAVLLNAKFLGGFIFVGTLARVPLGGGAPREIAADVQWADWNPAGDSLAILRTVGGNARIEMPIGTVRYQTTGWIHTPKVSPDGRSIAFIEHPLVADDSGFLAVIGPDGKKRVLTPYYNSIEGLAWKPDGREIWYTGGDVGSHRALYAVAESGEPRLVVSTPGSLIIHDIARDGRVLIDESMVRIRSFVRHVDQDQDREMSWLDWTLTRDITPDGKRVLLDESGIGAGKKYGVYVRSTDGSAAVRLGDGSASCFSPDGQSVLAISDAGKWSQIFLYPTGAGESRQITTEPMTHTSAAWTADGRSIVYCATDGVHPVHLYIRDIAGGSPHLLTAEPVGPRPLLCSPNGKWVFANAADGSGKLYPLHGGGAMALPEITRDDFIAGWTQDGRGIRYFRRGENPAHVMRLDLATHRSTVERDVTAPQSAFGIPALRMTPDGRAYGYNIYSMTSDLFLLEGVR